MVTADAHPLRPSARRDSSAPTLQDPARTLQDPASTTQRPARTPLRSAHRPLPRLEDLDSLRPGRRSVLLASAALPLASAGLVACSGQEGGAGPPAQQAELPRADLGDPETAGAATIAFTARLLGAIERAEANTVCSPLSAQIALTMAGLGAVGDTRAQMEQALGGSMDELAEAANTLSGVLTAVGEDDREDPEEDTEEDKPDPAVASLVNGVWAQEGMSIQEPFLEDLATWFGSGVHEVDYVDADHRKEARQRINTWVEDTTDDLIQELIPTEALSEDTRMVLVNALHLKASWTSPLTTGTGPFTTADAEQIDVETLSGSTARWYEDELCRATALDTHGSELSLALIQPVTDLATVLDAWAESADDPSVGLGAVLDGLTSEDDDVELTVPAFDIAWNALLSPVLSELGMADAFQAGRADFSGITTEEELMISEVIQKAVITVDEAGMEAAAATAVVMDAASAPADPKELVLDAPFLFVAYETSSRAPLVLGWIGDPGQTR